MWQRVGFSEAHSLCKAPEQPQVIGDECRVVQRWIDEKRGNVPSGGAYGERRQEGKIGGCGMSWFIEQPRTDGVATMCEILEEIPEESLHNEVRSAAFCGRREMPLHPPRWQSRRER